MWNVFATPELSLQPVTHCFPIAGCVAYRGYYQQGAARGAAALMRQDGLDVYLGGVEAYSTLGWFDDPILSSMVGWGDERLATLIFHELAHQRFYVQGDTEFNESFASFVEQEGTRQWRAARGLAAVGEEQGQQRDQFIRLVLASRERLQAIYGGPLDDAHKRQAKQAEFERLRREYRQVRDGQWGGDKRYDAWMYGPMNNASCCRSGCMTSGCRRLRRCFVRWVGIGFGFISGSSSWGGCRLKKGKRRCSVWWLACNILGPLRDHRRQANSHRDRARFEFDAGPVGAGFAGDGLQSSP